MPIPTLGLSFKNLKRQGQKISSKFSTCPKCGYSIYHAKHPTSLPGGINASLLLENSPTPQLLLSETNVIVYANKSAARVLRVKQLEKTEEEPKEEIVEERTRVNGEGGEAEEDPEEFEKPTPTGLEGHAIEQLNIEIADKDLRRWVTVFQVFENIKLNLAKREAKRDGRNAEQDVDLYGEGPKYSNYDYYGDQERAKRGSDLHADTTMRDTAPIVIEREDGKAMPATMFVSLIDPYHTGYSYSAISFIPGLAEEDATFATQLAEPADGAKPVRHERKRDKLRRKIGHRLDQLANTDPPQSEYSTAESGEGMLRRVARIKDLVLDEMEYCFIALSPDGDVVITNAATKAVLGQETLKASIGEGFEWIARLDIWRPDFSEPLPFEEWALNKLLTHHKPLTQVIGLYAGDVPLVVELRGKCIWENPEKEEGLLAALAIVVDQTQWFTKERLMQSTQLRQSRFISTIARELKTPVAGIIGLLELLYGTREHLNHEQMEYVRQTFGSINSLLLVINDIIDFNKISEGEVTISRRTFILQDLVQELGILFSESMAKEGVKFEVDTSKIDKSAFGDGTRLMLLADDSKIRRIAINMLSNAFKFTTKGKVIFRVMTQKVQRNSLEIKFEIKDTGVGISEGDQKRLFVPLDEMSGNEANIIGVDGIGLNIARKFVSLLGGDIGCSSIVAEGTNFWFTIPCGRPSPDSKVTFPPKEKTLSKAMGIVIHSKELEDEQKEEPSKNQAKVQIDGTVILLVEDNWAHQLVMEKRLQKMGCEVINAVNGRDALNILKKGEAMIDIIFMDIQMPLLDGFEATMLIRNDPGFARWKNIPIIGVTATEFRGDREKAKEFGLNEFTVKPLSNEVTKGFIEDMMDPVAVGKRVPKRQSTQTDISSL